MPVNSTHPDFDANLAAWSRARAVIAGEDAVKADGEPYLPRLDAQTDEEYTADKRRAVPHGRGTSRSTFNPLRQALRSKLYHYGALGFPAGVPRTSRQTKSPFALRQ